jgi:hypothetical protein
MAESPKEFFRRHLYHRWSGGNLPRPNERSPKAVFNYLARGQRQLAAALRDQEVGAAPVQPVP